ncbi:MAG: SMI1/KNR4 family protein [Burkholderiaceae bacterium]|nr:SMI1/KNR4 family protein [Burkholderiaceae bacterium]
MRRQFSQLVSEADVADFERVIAGKLPADYRAFLLEDNGGEPENACFTLLNNVGSYKESIVRYFFSTSDSPKFGLAYHYDIYVKANRIPKGSAVSRTNCNTGLINSNIRII